MFFSEIVVDIVVIFQVKSLILIIQFPRRENKDIPTKRDREKKRKRNNEEEKKILTFKDKFNSFER